jgi:4-amino-4-deoxy-L-arabinose transferase-like glycosyltransferase
VRPAHVCAVVGLVIAAGAAVRLVGLDHGRPDKIYHPDVSKQAQVAWGIGVEETFRLSTHFARINDLVLYPYGTATAVGYMARLSACMPGARDALARSTRWAWAYRMRILVVVLMLGAAGGVTAAACRVVGPGAALAAGLLTVLEPVNAQFSHYAMNDVPLTALLMLCWLCSGGMLRARYAWLFALLCGFTAGLGFAVKYTGLYAVFFPGIVWLTAARDRGPRWALSTLAALGAGALAGVAVLDYLLVTEPGVFFKGLVPFLRWQTDILMERNDPVRVKLLRNALWLGRFFLTSGLAWVVPFAAAGAVLRPAPGEPRAARLLAATAFGYALLMTATVWVSRELLRQNDLLTIMPFLVWPAARAVRLLPRSGSARARALGWVAAAAAVVLTAVYAVNTVLDSLAFRREDTRAQAERWCRAHIAPRARVLAERYTLPIAREDVKAYTVRSLAEPKARRFVRDAFLDVIITSSLAHERHYDPYSPYYDERAQALIDGLPVQYRLAAQFEDRPMLFAHPAIRVYVRREKRRP